MDSEDGSTAHLYLNIFTLNCWGLAFISKNRDKRMRAIAKHLNEQNYDIVFLQEIWLESDFNYINSVVKSNFKFSYFFKNSSFFGNPGLALFSKYQPSNLHFEKFATNGNPFKLWHGDWFTGKGVAYALIPINGYNFHLFNTHFHAQYTDNEALDSQYSIHRLCQSYQLAKFINLNTNFTRSQSYNGRDVVILAGDLNTPPEDLPYKLLLSMTGLHDSCHVYQKQKIVEYGHHKEEDFITCGHPFNTYTAQKTQYVKRIDYILFKLITGTCKSRLVNLAGDSGLSDHHPYIIDRIECKTKCDLSGLSFSDHQPVAIKLGLKHTEIPPNASLEQKADELSEDALEAKAQAVSSINCSSHVSIETLENGVCESHNVITFNGDEECKVSLGGKKLNGQSIKNRKSSGNFSNLNEEESSTIRKESTLFLLRSKCFGDNPNEILKDIEKLESNDYSQIYHNKNFYLKTCQKLFTRYLNRTTSKLWILTVLLLLIFVTFTFVLIAVNLTNIEFPLQEYINRNNVTIVCGFLNTLTIIGLIILQITYRLEVNSIFWILRESNVLLSNEEA